MYLFATSIFVASRYIYNVMGGDSMIGDMLKQLRKENKQTQQDLANFLGISRGTYAHYEINRREPDAATLIKLADYFHVSVDALLSHTPARDQQKEISSAALSTEETELLHKYRQVDPTKRASIQNFVNYLYIQEQQDRKEQEGA